MKTIYLARHAKSSWKLSLADFNRPLNKRGESDAVNMGEKLKELSWVPEKIIASPAQRAKQTCEAYCDSLNYSIANVTWDKSIYEARTVALLQILSNIDEGVQIAMLIGHNPAMENLLIHLCGVSSASKHQQYDGKLMTTGNVAKITINTLWKDIVMGEAQLDKLLRPKEI